MFSRLKRVLLEPRDLGQLSLEPASFQSVPDRVSELLEIDWLLDEVVGAQFQRLHGQIDDAEGGNHDYG